MAKPDPFPLEGWTLVEGTGIDAAWPESDKPADNSTGESESDTDSDVETANLTKPCGAAGALSSAEPTPPPRTAPGWEVPLLKLLDAYSSLIWAPRTAPPAATSSRGREVPFPSNPCCGAECPYCGRPCTLVRAHWRRGSCKWHEHLLDLREVPWGGSDCHMWRLEGPAGDWRRVCHTARVFGLFSGPALRPVRSVAPEHGSPAAQEEARDRREAQAEEAVARRMSCSGGGGSGRRRQAAAAAGGG